MRIISGRYKGKLLLAPAGSETRPTLNSTREAIFNLLANSLYVDFQGVTALDIFSGSGALGFEALSRGANNVIFIDNSLLACHYIEKNGANICDGKDFLIHSEDATSLSDRSVGYKMAALAFMDPPYDKNMVLPTLTALEIGSWLKKRAIIVIETRMDEYLEVPEKFSIVLEKFYGKTKITFLCFK